MNTQVRDFYQREGINIKFLKDEPSLDWNEAKKLGVPRGWYELSKVSIEDRVDFVKALWLKTLSFHLRATEVIEEFFDSLDDIIVVACAESEDEPSRVELVYSFADNSTFFRGLVPAEEEDIFWAKRQLEPDLPSDFWAFFRLHNGFGRRAELGLLALEDLEEARDRLIHRIVRSDKGLRLGGDPCDPYTLFPFFEQFGSFQCFAAGWYPESEMGNVYFSGIDYTVSNVGNRKTWTENFAYPTFLEWLAAYLEGTNRCI